MSLCGLMELMPKSEEKNQKNQAPNHSKKKRTISPLEILKLNIR